MCVIWGGQADNNRLWLAVSVSKRATAVARPVPISRRLTAVSSRPILRRVPPRARPASGGGPSSQTSGGCRGLSSTVLGMRIQAVVSHGAAVSL